MNIKQMVRISLLPCIASLIICLSMNVAWAHQKKTAITTVLFNERTGNIEVQHRFLLHDAEHAVKQIRGAGFKKTANIINSEQTRLAFSKYVEERFSIVNQNNELLKLSLVGSEIEGSNIWVYQETPIPAELKSMTIRHNALRDIWHEQVNRLNIERNNKTDTLIFQNNIDRLTFSLSSH